MNIEITPQGMVVVRETITRPCYRDESIDGGFGRRSVADGTETCEVVLEIDAAMLSQRFGTKAMRSRGRKSTALDGYLRSRVVKVLSRVGAGGAR